MVNEFIDISKKLKTILSEFNGAQGNSEEKKAKSLMSAFQQIAGKLLYGGHFVVTDENGGVIRRVFLHTVEFYYHEENEGTIKDYIVYHRNPENPYKSPQMLPPFPVGSLHTHVSGVDITFEDNRNGNNPLYRASALVRAFRVEEVKKNTSIAFSQGVDDRSTYFYNALFMGG